MANENATATEERSNTPLLIIGLVLVVALLGGWWFYSSSTTKSTASNGNTNSTSGTKPKGGGTIPPDAPPGAQPPNQKGSVNAAVTLEEFADFQCPQCAKQHPNMNEIKSMFGTRINFIFREFPLDIKAHDKSYDAAVAAEAAGMQGKFWEMQNMLFSNQKAWTDNDDFKQMWKDYAQKIGLDIPKWENDIAGLGAKTRVNADRERGKAIGINSTPSLYVNGNLVRAEDLSVDTIKAMIDAELAKGAAPPGQPASNAAANADAAPAGQQ